MLEAMSPDHAFTIVEQRSAGIDLLITDVVIPGESGVSLAERVRAHLPSIGVLFMTGYESTHLDGRDLEAEGSILLEKPFQTSAFLTAVSALLPVKRKSEDDGGGSH